VVDHTWIRYEFDNFEYHDPADADLAKIQRPAAVLRGLENSPFNAEAASWLSSRLGVQVLTISAAMESITTCRKR
jgi:hypothetical protein